MRYLPKTLEGNPSIASPEAELWAAVLIQAIDDLHGMRLLPVIRRSAECWFQSKNHDPGSFLWICDFLGLAASTVRGRHLREQAKQQSELRLREQVTPLSA
jgi:hypothetical protein